MATMDRVFLVTHRYRDEHGRDVEYPAKAGRGSLRTYKTLKNATKEAGEYGRVLILDFDLLDEALVGEDLHEQYRRAEEAMLRWAKTVEHLKARIAMTVGEFALGGQDGAV